MEDFKFIAIIMPFVKNVAFAIITLVIGLFLIKWLTKFIERQIQRSHLDNTLKPFFASIINTSLKILLGISVIRILGVDTSSFVAVIGAAGLAIGLAFQGSLSNFAGGVLLLALRPFKVGDYIEADGFSGTVESIQVLYTNLITPDNKVIYIPNGSLSNASIINYSVKDTRRVDLQFSVGYESDIGQVEKILRGIIEKHEQILKDPEPFIRLTQHGDSALVFTVRIWTKSADYWSVHFDLIESVKRKFDEEKILIPYLQMDVHVKEK